MLREQVVTRDDLGAVRWVAGADMGFEDDGRITRAAVTVLSFPELQLHEHALARRPTEFPYVPSLLSFREVPAVLEALTQLRQRPDLVLCDGQGIAHPRRCGLASHLGLVTDLPVIGGAKSRLIGVHAPATDEKGTWSPLFDGEERIGAVLRTRACARPCMYRSAIASVWRPRSTM